MASTEVPTEALLEVVKQNGTPTYAYDRRCLQDQVQHLRSALPSRIEVYYSLKANPSLGLCSILSHLDLGADVASEGELLVALRAGFSPDRICVTGPHKSPAMLSRLESLPDTLISLDSVDECRQLAAAESRHEVVVRLRPDFDSEAMMGVGPESRFGVPFDELESLGAVFAHSSLRLVGFHVFGGSQVLATAAVAGHLRRAFDLGQRAADVLGVRPRLLNLGGGFGIPYGQQETELPLSPIAETLSELAASARSCRLAIELGRYLVGPCGWYLTRVLGQQTNQGRFAVVVDGGTHQRADVCGLGLRQRAASPIALVDANAPRQTTDVLGSTSHPDDVLAERSSLPPLRRGDVVAFPNAGAYGFGASPALFHSNPLPAEVVFEGLASHVIRTRETTEDRLRAQVRPGER